jgi:hypothetical protein
LQFPDDESVSVFIEVQPIQRPIRIMYSSTFPYYLHPPIPIESYVIILLTQLNAYTTSIFKRPVGRSTIMSM